MYRPILPSGSRPRMRGYARLKCVMAVALLGGAQLPCAAAPTAATPAGKQVGIVTILEGRATVIRGLSQFDAQEGVRLLPNDLVRTDANTFLRLEYVDKTYLELGPETQLQLQHPGLKKPSWRPGVYLLEGWLKLECHPDPGSTCSLTSRIMDVADLTGTLILRATGPDFAAFAEQGSARLSNRGIKGATTNLGSGDFVSVSQGKLANVQKRATPEFLAALPRAYRDTLPIRYSIYEGRAATTPNQRAFSYADVEPWINAEAPVRRQFVVLWRRKAFEPGFREPLDRDLAMHPEWDRVLHPEKYEVIEPAPNVPPERKPTSLPTGNSNN